MKKSIYSLVLSDSVVKKVDELAYQLHTSRSNVINQVLAEHFSCVTPEMRMQAIFSEMESLVEHFRIPEQTSAHVFAVQSQLNYRYKPTVQYFVELYRNPKTHEIGKLKVQLRTQNQKLLLLLEQFFELWILLEQKYLQINAKYDLTSGKLERTLQNPDVDELEFGKLLNAYVQRFDNCMKVWFAEESPEELENIFQKELQHTQKFI